MGSKAKTEEGAELGDGSPKKKKHEVVSKETVTFRDPPRIH